MLLKISMKQFLFVCFVCVFFWFFFPYFWWENKSQCQCIGVGQSKSPKYWCLELVLIIWPLTGNILTVFLCCLSAASKKLYFSAEIRNLYSLFFFVLFSYFFVIFSCLSSCQLNKFCINVYFVRFKIELNSYNSSWSLHYWIIAIGCFVFFCKKRNNEDRK